MRKDNDIVVRRAGSREDLQGILALQVRNLERSISAATLQREGFVTVEHDLPTLTAISGRYEHVIATTGDQVVGYAVVMLKEFAHTVPVLVPMFDVYDRLHYRGRPLREVAYVVMGQVCVDEDHRGSGLFADLYRAFFAQMRPDFELVLTEVAARNPRSVRAHEKVGFEVMRRYASEQGEEWIIIGKGL